MRSEATKERRIQLALCGLVVINPDAIVEGDEAVEVAAEGDGFVAHIEGVKAEGEFDRRLAVGEDEGGEGGVALVLDEPDQGSEEGKAIFEGGIGVLWRRGPGSEDSRRVPGARSFQDPSSHIARGCVVVQTTRRGVVVFFNTSME